MQKVVRLTTLNKQVILRVDKGGSVNVLGLHITEIEGRIYKISYCNYKGVTALKVTVTCKHYKKPINVIISAVDLNHRQQPPQIQAIEVIKNYQ